MFWRHRVVVSIATRQSGPVLIDTLRLLRRFRDRPRDAGPWGEPAFAREVERIRRDLAPIVSRRSLAESFAREAVRPAAVRVAYSVRWFELDDDDARPPWTSLVTERD
jgi:hypothetical protein